MTGSPGPGPNPDVFAALLCDWCLAVSPGQQIQVSSTTLAEPLLLALHRAILQRDAWPLLRISPPGLPAQFYRHAGGRHLDGFAPAELAEMRVIDSLLSIDAPANASGLADVDPTLIQRFARGREQLRAVRMTRRWCNTSWPTPSLAQQAGMSEAGSSARLARSGGAPGADRAAPARCRADPDRG